MRTYGIILAAGDGARVGSTTPKCFIELDKKMPIFLYSLRTFCKVDQFRKIILVVPQDYVRRIKFNDKRIVVTAGGKTRNESFEQGMKIVKRLHLKNNDKIVIHDGARPHLHISDLLKVVNNVEDFGTLCHVGQPNERDLCLGNYNIQTPQFCRYLTYKNVKNKNPDGRDLLTYLNLKPKASNFIFANHKDQNLKITFVEDLTKAKSM